MENIIVGIGEILWDVLPNGKVLGGAPANFAYHVSQFGFDGRVISAIGQDSLGEEIIDNLDKKGLKCILEKTPFPTGTVLISLVGNGIPEYEITQNVAWDNMPFSPEMEKMARNTKTVCFGSLAQRSKTSQITIHQFLDFVPSNAFKIFDINLRQHFYTLEVIHNSLSRCNVLKINDEEVVIVAKLFGWVKKSELEICKQLLENYALKMVVLTKGTQGSFVISKTETSFKPTPEIKVADTVGAGDSFTAGFISSLLKGKSLTEAHEIAVEVAAYVCTHHGAMPQLPDSILRK